MSGHTDASPMELGELEASPDFRHSPQIILEPDADDMSYINQPSSSISRKTTEKSSKLPSKTSRSGESRSTVILSPDNRHEEVEDVLIIQPPQATKERHRHKHKEARKRPREARVSESDSRHTRKADRPSSSDRKYDSKYEQQKSLKKEELEAEETRRKKSLEERDRLERLERERRRLEVERERKYREQQERTAKEELEKRQAAKEELEKRVREEERRDETKRGSAATRDDYDRRPTARDDEEKKRREQRLAARSYRGAETSKHATRGEVGRERQRGATDHVGGSSQPVPVRRARSRSPLPRSATSGDRERQHDTAPREVSRSEVFRDVVPKDRESYRESRRDGTQSDTGRRDIDKESKGGRRDVERSEAKRDKDRERERDGRDDRRGAERNGRKDADQEVQSSAAAAAAQWNAERRSISPSSSGSSDEAEHSPAAKAPQRPPGGASAALSDDEAGTSDRSPADDDRQNLSASPDQGNASDQKSDGSGDESENSTKSSSSEHSDTGSYHPDPAHLVRSKFDSTALDDSRSSSSSSSRSSSRGDDNEADDNNHDYQSESPVPSPVILKPELPPYFPGFQGCRNVEEFQCLNRIEEGTYGVVYRARDVKTEEIVALKRLKMEKEREGFPITSLREINTLLKSQHPNIVTVREIVVGSNMDKIYIVMDYVEHDLKSLMESMKESFSMGEVKTLMLQLLRGVGHLHDNWIIHRDLKTSNLLLSHKGILKIGDFGLAREYGSPLRHYTPIVVTLWYRAPELLLGSKEYSTPIDMWSVGCIFAEFLMKKPLFPGKSEIDELNRIFKELGTPTEKIWSGVGELPAMKKCTFTEYPYNQLRGRFGTLLTDKGFDLLNKFLTYNPSRRISSEDALKHEYFVESPLPVDPSMFPTWPAKSEQSRSRVHGNSPKPPSGGKAYAKLIGDDDELGTGFHLAASAAGIAAASSTFALKF